MDKKSAPVPSNDDMDQKAAPTVANPAPNLPLSGAGGIDVNRAPSLLNPWAAAAIAMANQQVAQSLQQSQRLNTMFGGTQANANATAQTQQVTTAETQQPSTTASSSSLNGSVNSTAASQNNVVAQAMTLNPLGALPLSGAAHNPFVAAALLGGGFLPGLAAPALAQQQQHVQQLLANNVTTLDQSRSCSAAKKSSRKSKGKASRGQQKQQHSLHRTGSSVANAAAQVAAAHVAATNTVGIANALLANMQNWKLDQLEAHVQLLQDSGQQVPQAVAMLLSDARRKEEKRTAKRAANRKSACTSRARKKALVEEMTKANARLRRQAMILALLPDLVIAMTTDGKITFCSAQVERVLRHKTDDLVGANFADILIPPSRDRLCELVKELLAAEQAATLAGSESDTTKPSDAEVDPPSNQEISSGGEANQVSDGSFPLAVVNFANEPNAAEDNSDLSASNGGGKTTDDARGGSSPKEGDSSQVKSDVSSGSNQQAQAQASSDDSLSSSNDAKNLRKANEALSRNVRWHNEKLASEGKVGKKNSSHKDDVTGASVTANNADARLSSLQVKPESSTTPTEEKTRKRKTASRYDSLEEQSSSSYSDLMLDAIEKKKARKNGIENSSEDSGYRESNQSEEDTFDDSSSLRNGPRPKPLAPACNICLIRDDLTTIWCEVTSSIRTRSLKDDSSDEQMGPLEAKAAAASAKESSTDTSKAGEEDPKDEIKELLLCLRPIRDGEEPVDESLRFVPPKKVELLEFAGRTESSDPPSSASTSADGKAKSRPPKKRPIVSEPSSSSVSNDSKEKNKKPRIGEEKSAVESLMLMGNKTSN